MLKASGKGFSLCAAPCLRGGVLFVSREEWPEVGKVKKNDSPALF